MRIREPDRKILIKKIIAKKRNQMEEKRKLLLQDPRIDELIDRCAKEASSISSETLIMIGRHWDPAGMPGNLIREKAAYILGIKLPLPYEIDEEKISDEVLYLIILGKSLTEVEKLLDNY